VRGAGSVDSAYLLEPERPAVEPLEQTSAGAEDQGCDRNVDLVVPPSISSGSRGWWVRTNTG
jgi:hypothetical protein